jgi:hypothetical protein
MTKDASQYKEMFLLNIASNAGSDETGDNIEQKVFDEISKYLVKHGLTNWEIAWGPGVYVKYNGSVPDNVIFLAFDKTTRRYFLSVAGTNADSIVDWFQDLDVSTTVQWPWNNAGSEVQIASGSMAGLSVLMGLKGKACVNGIPVGDAVLLQDYLKQTLQNAGSGTYRFLTGGHSLGGALAPLLALWLLDTHENWDVNTAIQSFESWPSAGPTIGTDGFKTYYNERVLLTTRIHNTLDVVPHAWNKTSLAAIKTLYTPEIEHSDFVDLLVNRSIKKTGDIQYVQAGLTDVPLTGKVNTDIIEWYYPPAVNFISQLGYQHVNAYFKLLDIDTAAKETPPDAARAEAYLARVAAFIGSANDNNEKRI